MFSKNIKSAKLNETEMESGGRVHAYYLQLESDEKAFYYIKVGSVSCYDSMLNEKCDMSIMRRLNQSKERRLQHVFIKGVFQTF